MRKKYKGLDYLLAFLVTVGCSIFILYPVMPRTMASNSPFPCFDSINRSLCIKLILLEAKWFLYNNSWKL